MSEATPSASSDLEILDPESIPLPFPSQTASSAGSHGELIKPPHLGEGLQDCLKSLRKFALETISEVTEEDDKSDELTKVLKAAKDVVKSFYKNIWFTEGCQRAARKPFNTFPEFKKMSVLEYKEMMKELPENLNNLLVVHFNKDWNDTNKGDELQVVSKPVPNMNCPITGVPVFLIQDPVRNIDCRHVYDRSAIVHYIRNRNKCPCIACPRYIYADLLLYDDNLKDDLEVMKGAGPEDAAEKITTL